ncbi:autotransporter outer membrane beta-barrel domain-containing protein, partial [Escherichia coli]|uniref:autotransporter outer membrane beta-barrel domain-containing protein n=1 Tax=Escherichia coli TaxID=562 RepID=UPI000BE1C05A
FGFAENTDDLFVGKTLLHGDVLMWLMKTLLTSGCTNQRGAGHSAYTDANYLGGGDVDQDWSANVGVKYTW